MVRLWEVRHLKYTYTVHWQFGDSPSTDSDMRFVSSSTAEYICLPTCLSVCLWVCLFVYEKGILPFASDLYKLRHCLGLNIIVSETAPSQNDTIWSTQRKYVVVTLDHTGSSSVEHVCPMFQWLWTGAKKTLIACLSVCHQPTFLFS